MKKFKFIAVAGIVAASSNLFSCINDKEGVCPVQDQTIRLYVVGVDTRTNTGDINKSNVHEGNTVGAFGITSDEKAITNGANNKYTVGSDGTLTAENEMTAPERTENLKIFAYAPHNETWTTHNTDYDFTVASDQTDNAGYLASDLLYAEGSTIQKVTVNQNAIGLTFNHKMSRVQLNITKEADADDLNSASVTLNNTRPTIKFNPSTGDLGEVSGTATDITAIEALGSNKSVYAIVVPQTVNAGTVLFTIKKSDKSYTLKLSNDVNFESGKSYSFTVNIKASTPEDVEITLDGTPSVEDWGDGNGNNDGDADEEYLTKVLNLATFECVKGSSFILNPWVDNNDGTYTFSWMKTSNLSYLYLIKDEDLTSEEYSKFNSLVIEIKEFIVDPYTLSPGDDAYLRVRTKEDEIFQSGTQDFEIREKGTHIIDLTKYGNDKLFDNTSNLKIIGEASNTNLRPSATIEKVYFTTQKATAIKNSSSL